MSRTTWKYESTYSTVNFIKSKCRSSIPDEKLVLVLKIGCEYKICIRFQTLRKRM